MLYVLLILMCLTYNIVAIQWEVLSPKGDKPPKVSKPNCVSVNRRDIVCFNGVEDNCSDQTNYWYNNSQVYVYNTRRNKGEYIQTTGDIPPSSAFATAWKSGTGKVTVGGGLGDYTFFYQGLVNRNYSVLFELDIDTKVWRAFAPSGDIPTPRGEVSMLVDPDDNSQVYLFGGVSSLGSFILIFR